MGKELINNLLEGRDSTLFALGVSGSGKTHTLIGDSKTPEHNYIKEDNNLEVGCGLIYRMIKYLFEESSKKFDVYGANVCVV